MYTGRYKLNVRVRRHETIGQGRYTHKMLHCVRLYGGVLYRQTWGGSECKTVCASMGQVDRGATEVDGGATDRSGWQKKVNEGEL